MVQLSSQRNEDAAWTAWDQLSKRHGELLGGRDAAVVRAELDGKGVFYRLRVHRLQSRNEAQSLCSRLKARGTACYFGRAEGLGAIVAKAVGYGLRPDPPYGSRCLAKGLAPHYHDLASRGRSPALQPGHPVP
jgi:hypothetical protein